MLEKSWERDWVVVAGPVRVEGRVEEGIPGAVRVRKQPGGAVRL
jgi:hypothetical protein